MPRIVSFVGRIKSKYKEWSVRLVSLLPVRKGSIACRLLENILPALILNSCNTVIVSAVMILYNEAIPAELRMVEWMAGMVHDWPIMLVISYFAAFLAEAVGVRVARRYCCTQ